MRSPPANCAEAASPSSAAHQICALGAGAVTPYDAALSARAGFGDREL